MRESVTCCICWQDFEADPENRFLCCPLCGVLHVRAVATREEIRKNVASLREEIEHGAKDDA